MRTLKKLFLGIGFSTIASAVFAISVLTVNSLSIDKTNADYSVTAVDNPGASFSTKRIWVINNNSSFYDASAAMAIGLSGGVTWTVIKPGTHTNNGGQVYYFFDVPLATTKFKLLRCDSTYSTVWGEIGEVSTINPAKIYFVSTTSYSGVPSTGDSSSSKPDAYLLANVLRGYCTCLSSSDNGYGAVADLKTTWFDHYAGDVNGTQATVSLDDYPDGAFTGGAYSSTAAKTGSLTVANKWAAMQAKAASASTAVILPSKENGSTANVAVTAIGGLALLSAGGYLFLKKKPKRI